jgi:hypothetical protein
MSGTTALGGYVYRNKALHIWIPADVFPAGAKNVSKPLLQHTDIPLELSVCGSRTLGCIRFTLIFMFKYVVSLPVMV